MKKTFAFASAFALCAGIAGADAADLRITEVLEGYASLKFVEIYNTGATPVDLASPQVTLRRYANGSATSGDLNLVGTIPAGGFFVIANNSTDYDAVGYAAKPVADQYSTIISHNGDDYYELFDGTNVVDSFAGDLIGVSNPILANAVAVRESTGNDGAWGGTTQPADGQLSDSGFWRVFNFADNASSLAVASPGAGAPTSVSDWTMY